MAQSPAYCLQQAEVCAQAAANTPLENQRAALLRSQAAWLSLAARELAVQAARTERQPAATKDDNDAQ